MSGVPGLSGSSSDSDSDGGGMERRMAKRARRGGRQDSAVEEEGPAAPPTSPVPPNRRPKAHNSIWSDVLSEQTLTAGLKSDAGVYDSTGLVSRDVESFPLPAHLLNKPNTQPSKAKNGNRQNDFMVQKAANDSKKADELTMELDAYMAAAPTSSEAPPDDPFADDHSEAAEPLSQQTKRQGKRTRSRGGNWRRQKAGAAGAPRPIPVPDLELDAAQNPVLLAGRMAEALKEPKVELIERVVEKVGAAKAVELFKRTVAAQAGGGLFIADKSRLRSPGGVFLFFLREDSEILPEAKQDVFHDDREKTRKFVKAKRAVNPSKPFDQILAETKQVLASKAKSSEPSKEAESTEMEEGEVAESPSPSQDETSSILDEEPPFAPEIPS